MRRSVLILVLALVAASCGGDGSDDPTTTQAPATTAATTTTTAATTSTEAPPTTATATTTTEAATTTAAPEPPAQATGALVISSIDFAAEVVTITNVTDADYSLEGHFACNFPNYASISDIGTLAPGESVTVPIATVGISAVQGEFGIYTSSNFGSSSDMVAYVEWGTSDHGRSSVAVGAGLWVDGDFVDNGEAGFRALTTGGSSDDYELIE